MASLKYLFNSNKNFDPILEDIEDPFSIKSNKNEEPCKTMYRQIMNLPINYSYFSLKQVFEFICKRYHKEKDVNLYFENIYYSLITEAYDYLKLALTKAQKEDKAGIPKISTLEIIANEDKTLKEIKETYHELCLKKPGIVITNTELKREYLLKKMEKVKINSRPFLNQFYQNHVHKNLDSENLLNTSKKEVSEENFEYSYKDFYDLIKDKTNCYFKLNLPDSIFLPLILETQNTFEKAVNYEIKVQKEKSFLCSNCSVNQNYCTTCNNTGQYKKKVTEIQYQEANLKLTKDILKKSFLIIPNKGHKNEKTRGFLLIEFAIGSLKNQEKIVYKYNQLKIYKALFLNQLQNTNSGVDVILNCVNKIITISALELKGIPFKKDITSQFSSITYNKNLRVTLILSLKL